MKSCFAFSVILLLSLAYRNVEGVVCPDGTSACPDGTTCCLIGEEAYGCCPIPNAVCCKDQRHCCPEGSYCDTAEGQCFSRFSGIALPMFEKIPAHQILPAEKHFAVAH